MKGRNIDKQGRLYLGREHINQAFVVDRRDDGVIILTPLQLATKGYQTHHGDMDFLWQKMRALSKRVDELEKNEPEAR